MNLTASSDIRLVIPCQPEFVGLARLAAAGIAHRMELDVEQADDLKLAVTEACGYLLGKRGASGEASSTIEVEWQLSSDQLQVRVHRAGIQTELETDPGEAEIGLFLIHALMDEVSETEDGSGLVMTKSTRRTEHGREED